MNEARNAIRFTLKRESRNLYVFSLEDGTEVQFADQHRAWNREFAVVSGSSRFQLSSKGFSPPITLASQEGLVLKGTNSMGSKCFSWTSANLEYQLIGRRPRWLGFAFLAFHLHSQHRRVAYWAQSKRTMEIRGVVRHGIPVIEIATVVFGVMYDWDDGTSLNGF